MDVVNGKIVSAESGRSDLWSGIKRSFGSAHDGGGSSQTAGLSADQRKGPKTHGGSEDWTPSWGGSSQTPGVSNCGAFYMNNSMAPLSNQAAAGRHGRAGMPSIVGSNGTGRWDSSMVRASSLRPAAFPVSGADGDGMAVMQSMTPIASGGSLRPPTVKPQVGASSRSASVSDGNNVQAAAAGAGSSGIDQPPAARVGHHKRGHRRSHHQYSTSSFDQEMSRFEMQIARTASRHVDRLPALVSVASLPPLCKKTLPPGGRVERSQSTEIRRSKSGDISSPSPTPATDSESKLVGDGAAVKGSSNLVTSPANSSMPGCSNKAPPYPESSANLDPQRKASQSSGDDKVLRTWIEPLKCLLRKGLTTSDVGELGRIILPKKDAEGQLPWIDIKEGKLLTFEDYESDKHWVFRYKWWLNNKSRMYVLENTGDFIKYHSLKATDAFILYKDSVGKLVVHGEKAPRKECAVST